MPETGLVIRRAEPADTQLVARWVLRGARSFPGLAPKLLGLLMPRAALARLYRWMLASGRAEIWIAQTGTAFAAVVVLNRGAFLEAVDFVSTGEMLGLKLAVEMLDQADRRGLTVVLDTHGRVRQSYFRRLGFEPAGPNGMVRRPHAPKLA